MLPDGIHGDGLTALPRPNMTQPVLIQRHASTLVLTLNRAHAGNSISTEVVEALQHGFEEARAEPQLRCVIITGAGEKFFSSGGDLKRYRALQTSEQLRAAFAGPRALMDRIEAFPIPVIAAVNGWALGGGAELMLAADIRIAARDARIGFPYVKLSLMPGWHGAERLVQTVGHAAASVLLLRGTPVGAEQALQLGLVHELADRDQLLNRALAIAEDFATAAPLSLAATKQLLRGINRLDHAGARALADASFEQLWLSRDHREAEAAFAEKRQPLFRGN